MKEIVSKFKIIFQHQIIDLKLLKSDQLFRVKCAKQVHLNIIIVLVCPKYHFDNDSTN